MTQHSRGMGEQTEPDMTGKIEGGIEGLLPCPFCGGKAERLDFETVWAALGNDPNAGGSCITCKRCGASSPVHFDRKENLCSSWNERAASTLSHIRRETVEAAATIALEQRCERGTDWDFACVAIAEKIRSLAPTTGEGERAAHSEADGALHSGLEGDCKYCGGNQSPTPGHTDLMVTPESIDAFMEANPLPQSPAPLPDDLGKVVEKLIDNWLSDYVSHLPPSSEVSRAIVSALRSALSATTQGAGVVGEVVEALTKLSNEVLGTLPLMEELARREFGNTNYVILMQRAEEAREILSLLSSKEGE